jgi:hypothetical protein
MDGWYGMDFVRKVSTSMANGKKKNKSWYYPPPKERDRVVRHSTPEVNEVFLAQPVLRGCGLSHTAFGPFASAAGACAVPAPPASSPGSAVLA